jgi:hypothetical protein
MERENLFGLLSAKLFDDGLGTALPYFEVDVERALGPSRHERNFARGRGAQSLASGSATKSGICLSVRF